MISPRDRLLLVFALTALPAAVLSASGNPGWFAATACLVAAASVIDAIAALRRIRSLSAMLPEVIRMVQTRPTAIPVMLRSGEPVAGLVRVAVQIPNELGCAKTEQTVIAPEAGQSLRIEFACTPNVRGTYNIKLLAVGVAGRLGLFEAHRRIRVNCEIRVYPDLLAGQRSLAPLVVRHSAGLHVNRQVGRGREFEKLREYLPGDPMSDIHWKATARRAKPVTRVYQIERTQEIYCVLDCSRLTSRPVGSETILDRYVSSSLALNLASRQQGDLYGLITFSDTVHSFLRAGKGPAHYDACRNALLNLKPRLVAPDYNEVFASIQSRLRRRALLIFLTELDDPVLAEDFQSGAAGLTRRHLLAAASVQEPAEAPLFTSPVASTGEIYERLAGHMAWRRLEELRVRLRASGIRFSVVDASKLGLEMARVYLNVKRQQIL